MGGAKLLKLAHPGSGAKLLKCGGPFKSSTPRCLARRPNRRRRRLRAQQVRCSVEFHAWFGWCRENGSMNRWQFVFQASAATLINESCVTWPQALTVVPQAAARDTVRRQGVRRALETYDRWLAARRATRRAYSKRISASPMRFARRAGSGLNSVLAGVLFSADQERRGRRQDGQLHGSLRWRAPTVARFVFDARYGIERQFQAFARCGPATRFRRGRPSSWTSCFALGQTCARKSTKFRCVFRSGLKNTQKFERYFGTYLVFSNPDLAFLGNAIFGALRAHFHPRESNQLMLQATE